MGVKWLRPFLLTGLALIGGSALFAGLSFFELEAPSGSALAQAGGVFLLGLGLLITSAREMVPFSLWLGVPVIWAVAAALLVNTGQTGMMAELGAVDAAVGVGLISYAGLQVWADRRVPEGGRKSWGVLLTLTGLFILGYLIGLVLWLAPVSS